MSNNRLKIGDIIEIPLPDKRKALGRFLYKDLWGDLVGVYDQVFEVNEIVNVNSLQGINFMFPPILTRIKDGFSLNTQLKNLDEITESHGIQFSPIFKMMSKDGVDYDWKIIGNIHVENFKYPNFIWLWGGFQNKSNPKKWMLYNGKEDIVLGSSIPKEFSNLEYKCSYSPEAVINRIVTGKPFEIRQ